MLIRDSGERHKNYNRAEIQDLCPETVRKSAWFLETQVSADSNRWGPPEGWESERNYDWFKRPFCQDPLKREKCFYQPIIGDSTYLLEERTGSSIFGFPDLGLSTGQIDGQQRNVFSHDYWRSAGVYSRFPTMDPNLRWSTSAKQLSLGDKNDCPLRLFSCHLRKERRSFLR